MAHLTATCSERLADAARARAAEEGVSLADVIRDALAAHLQRSGHLVRFYPEASAVVPKVKRPSARANRVHRATLGTWPPRFEAS